MAGRITHHFRIDRVNMTFEVGPLHVLAPCRPRFMELTTRLKAGDMLVSHSACSIGSTAADVLQVLRLMREKGVETHSPMGRFISLASYQVAFRMLTVLIAAETAIRANRTSLSLQSTRSSGIKLGRPSALALQDQEVQSEVARRLGAGETQTSVAASLGVHRRTIRRLLDQRASIPPHQIDAGDKVAL